MLIVLEGIDGAGKTTQADRLEVRLRSDGLRVLRAREPGGTAIGERLRELLLDARRSEMDARTELFLYMASRAQLVAEVLLPALKRGDTVLLDRYYYSTAAYQGAAGRVGIEEVLELAERIAKFPRPDRVVLLDLDPRNGSVVRHNRFSRATSRDDSGTARFEDLERRYGRSGTATNGRERSRPPPQTPTWRLTGATEDSEDTLRGVDGDGEKEGEKEREKTRCPRSPAEAEAEAEVSGTFGSAPRQRFRVSRSSHRLPSEDHSPRFAQILNAQPSVSVGRACHGLGHVLASRDR
jgi:dTMP kinase